MYYELLTEKAMFWVWIKSQQVYFQVDIVDWSAKCGSADSKVSSFYELSKNACETC